MTERIFTYTQTGRNVVNGNGDALWYSVPEGVSDEDAIARYADQTPSARIESYEREVPYPEYLQVIMRAFPGDEKLQMIARQEMTYMNNRIGGRPSDNARDAVMYLQRALNERSASVLSSPSAEGQLLDYLSEDKALAEMAQRVRDSISEAYLWNVGTVEMGGESFSFDVDSSDYALAPGKYRVTVERQS